jgi:hypothetical protein
MPYHTDDYQRQAVLSLSGISFDASVFRVLRLFRLLQLERFVTAFTLLDDVWRDSKDVLNTTALLAVILWLTSATLFYLTEQVRTPLYVYTLQYAILTLCSLFVVQLIRSTACMHAVYMPTCCCLHMGDCMCNTAVLKYCSGVANARCQCNTFICEFALLTLSLLFTYAIIPL